MKRKKRIRELCILSFKKCLTLIIALLIISFGGSTAFGATAIWHLMALTLGVASAGMVSAEIENYNELIEKDEELYQEFQQAKSTAEIVEIEDRRQNNVDLLDEKKRNINAYYGVVTFAVIWELYLLFSAESRGAGFDKPLNDQMPRLALFPNPKNNSHSLSLEWKF